MGHHAGVGGRPDLTVEADLHQQDRERRPAAERTIYRIRHRYPNEATQKAVQIFEEKLEKYLEARNWGELEKRKR